MIPNNVSGRSSFSVSANPPSIPVIAINDEIASQPYADRLRMSMSSSNSYSSPSGTSSPLALTNRNSDQILVDHSHSPQSCMRHFAMDQQRSNDPSASLHNENLLAALSGLGSLHGCAQSDHQQFTEATLQTNIPFLELYADDTPYPHVPVGGSIPDLSPASQPRRGSGAPSIASEAFSFINDECAECQTKKDRLHVVESQVDTLKRQLETLQGVLRHQHRVLLDQQTIISNIQQQDDQEGKLPRRKRQFTNAQQDNTDPNGRSTSAPESSHISPKRGRFAPPQRKQTAETRQRGACVKCWKHKQRCEPGRDVDGPCKSCYEPTLSVLRIPCIRTHIVDLDLFRCSTGRNDTWTQRDEVGKIMDLCTYTSEERTHLMLTHGFGPQLTVSVRPYRPVRDDVTIYTWRDGQGTIQQREMPHYALADVNELISSVESFIEQNQEAYIQHCIDESNVPTFKALQIAREMAITDDNALMQETLKLWTAARLIEEPWQICGQETLGLEHGHHWWWIPVTPIMDTQLDQVVTQSCLLPLRKSVLQRLQQKIEKDCRNSWFEILITIVILLNSLEIATRHDHEFAKFFGHEYSAGRTRFEDYKLVESYFHSALTLLTHVKVIFDGRLPTMDANIKVSKLMDACQEGHEKDYIIEVDKYVNTSEKRKEFAKFRNQHQYEKQQFWVHQLFLEKWMSQPISIQEI